MEDVDEADEFGDGDAGGAPDLAGAELLAGDQALNAAAAEAQTLTNLVDGEELWQLGRIRIQGEET